MSPELTLKPLLGKTLATCKVGNNSVLFTTECGRQFEMTHIQDCCESVTVDGVIGDIDNIIGSPIISALEEISNNKPEDYEAGEYSSEGSETWTKFTIKTEKGSAQIMWFGTSNGYYSESVDFYEIK